MCKAVSCKYYMNCAVKRECTDYRCADYVSDKPSCIVCANYKFCDDEDKGCAICDAFERRINVNFN